MAQGYITERKVTAQLHDDGHEGCLLLVPESEQEFQQLKRFYEIYRLDEHGLVEMNTLNRGLHIHLFTDHEGT